MSRQILLGFFLLLVVFTSQLEWKQGMVNGVEARPSISQTQRDTDEKEEFVKEKIILSQEKNIQKLNEVVRGLREELLQCRGKTEAVNNTMTPLIELLNELE